MTAARRSLLVSCAVLWSGLHSPLATAHAANGTMIADVELNVVQGGKRHLLGKEPAQVLFFFRPDQEHSRAVMKQMAQCERDLAAKPLRWTGVVSDRFAVTELKAAIEQAGLAMPVVLDVGDAVYAALEAVQVPFVVIVDGAHKVVAFVPFMKINFCETVKARVLFQLGEMTASQLAAVLDPPASKVNFDASLARRHFTLAAMLFRSGSFDKALEAVQKSLELDASRAAAHALRGNILSTQDKCKDAIGAFDKALALDGAQADALAGRQACLDKLKK